MVCTSPHRKEIDELILKGWTLKEILRTLKAKYPDEKLPSYNSLKNHARYHVRDPIKEALEMNKEREKVIKRELKASMKAVELLRKNLERLSEILEKAWEEGIESSKKRKEIGTLIWRANQTIELLLKYAEKVEGIQLSEDEILDRILYCIADFPPNLVEKFKERWDRYGKRSS